MPRASGIIDQSDRSQQIIEHFEMLRRVHKKEAVYAGVNIYSDQNDAASEAGAWGMGVWVEIRIHRVQAMGFESRGSRCQGLGATVGSIRRMLSLRQGDSGRC